MIDNTLFQNEKNEAVAPTRCAVVTAIYPDGITIEIEPGVPNEKHYKVLESYIPKIGDRVYLAELSGTYLVLGKIGNPLEEIQIDRAAYAEDAGKLGGVEASQYVVPDQNNNITPNADVRDRNLASAYIQFRVASAGKLQFRSSRYQPNTWYDL